MSVPIKGSIIVADGSGHVTIISPTNNNEVLCLDSSDPKGAKFIKINNILPQQTFKVTATSSNNTTSSTYATIMELTVNGETTSPISSIKVLSRKIAQITSYDVRVYDTTNSNIIVERNFTNNNLEINDLGTLSNLPLSSAIFEIQ